MNKFVIENDEDGSVLKTIRIKTSLLKKVEELSNATNVSVNKIFNKSIEFALENLDENIIKKPINIKFAIKVITNSWLAEEAVTMAIELSIALDCKLPGKNPDGWVIAFAISKSLWRIIPPKATAITKKVIIDSVFAVITCQRFTGVTNNIFI